MEATVLVGYVVNKEEFFLALGANATDRKLAALGTDDACRYTGRHVKPLT